MGHAGSMCHSCVSLFPRCQNRGGFRILPESGLSMGRSTLPSRDREELAQRTHQRHKRAHTHTNHTTTHIPPHYLHIHHTAHTPSIYIKHTDTTPLTQTHRHTIHTHHIHTHKYTPYTYTHTIQTYTNHTHIHRYHTYTQITYTYHTHTHPPHKHT